LKKLLLILLLAISAFAANTKIACKDTGHKPVKIAGLKFLDVAKNLKGEYIYTYGLEK